MRPHRPLWRRRRWWMLAFAVTVLLLYLLRAQVLQPVARFLDVSEHPVPVDYVMVLGGGIETRPFVAAALVKAGLAKRVLVPGVGLSAAAQDGIIPPEHELIRRVLEARGVRAEAITLLPGEATNTADEARALAKFLQAEPECSVAVITNTLHTRRTRRIFRHILGADRVRFVAAPTDGYSEGNWWRFERGWQDYATEYAKLCLLSVTGSGP